MNPDVFITIAFAGIVLLVALMSCVLVLPRVWRESARVRRSESSRRRGSSGKAEVAAH